MSVVNFLDSVSFSDNVSVEEDLGHIHIKIPLEESIDAISTGFSNNFEYFSELLLEKAREHASDLWDVLGYTHAHPDIDIFYGESGDCGFMEIDAVGLSALKKSTS